MRFRLHVISRMDDAIFRYSLHTGAQTAKRRKSERIVNVAERLFLFRVPETMWCDGVRGRFPRTLRIRSASFRGGGRGVKASNQALISGVNSA